MFLRVFLLVFLDNLLNFPLQGGFGDMIVLETVDHV